MILFEDSGKFVGGALGDGLDSIGNSVSQGIINALTTILSYILGCGFWFCKVGILICVVLYICSHDQKVITTGFKLSFVYLIIALVGSAI